MAGRVLLVSTRAYAENTGNNRVTLTVDELGIVGRYRIRLYMRKTGQLIREDWSGTDGTCTFDWVPSDVYAVAHDHGTDPVNAAISDQLTLEPMP